MCSLDDACNLVSQFNEEGQNSVFQHFKAVNNLEKLILQQKREPKTPENRRLRFIQSDHEKWKVQQLSRPLLLFYRSLVGGQIKICITLKKLNLCLFINDFKVDQTKESYLCLKVFRSMLNLVTLRPNFETMRTE